MGDDLPDMIERFIHNGVEYDQVHGLGSVPDVENVEYLGFIVLMRPSVYLSLCPPLEPWAVAAFDKPIGMPFLSLDIEGPEGILNHEGRHRALYVMRTTGDLPMPVAMLPAYGARARHVTDECLERICAGIHAQRSSENQYPRFVEGPLFTRVLLSGRKLDAGIPDAGHRP